MIHNLRESDSLFCRGTYIFVGIRHMSCIDMHAAQTPIDIKNENQKVEALIISIYFSTTVSSMAVKIDDSLMGLS